MDKSGAFKFETAEGARKGRTRRSFFQDMAAIAPASTSEKPMRIHRNYYPIEPSVWSVLHKKRRCRAPISSPFFNCDVKSHHRQKAILLH
jgi:hypothetical protein